MLHSLESVKLCIFILTLFVVFSVSRWTRYESDRKQVYMEAQPFQIAHPALVLPNQKQGKEIPQAHHPLASVPMQKRFAAEHAGEPGIKTRISVEV